MGIVIGAGLPYWLHGKMAIQAFQYALEKSFHAPVSVGSIRFSWTPYPHMDIRDVQVAVPEKGETMVFPKITGTPSYFSMLFGKIQIRTLTLEKPEIRLQYEPSDTSFLDVFDRLPTPKEINALLHKFTKTIPIRKVVIQEGSFGLYKDDHPMLETTNLHATIRLRRKHLELTCKSNAWAQLSIKADLNPNAGEDISVTVQSLRLDRLQQGLFPQQQFFGPSVVSVSVSLFRDIDGQGHGKLNIEGPKVTLLQRLHPNKGPLLLDDVLVNVAAQFDGPKAKIWLKHLHLGKHFDIRASGIYNPDPKEPDFKVSVKSKAVQVQEIWDLGVSLVGKDPDLLHLAELMPSGEIENFNFYLADNHLATLGKLKNISLKGNVKNATIDIKDINLLLTHVSGRLAIKNGDIHVKNISASVPKEEFMFQNGVFYMSEKVPHTFKVDADLKGNIAKIPDFAKQFISKNAKAIQELDQIQQLVGVAQGHFSLDYDKDHMKIAVELKDSAISFSHPEIPQGVRIQSGVFEWKDDTGLDIKNVVGDVHAIRINGFGLTMPLKGGFKVNINEVTLPVPEIIENLYRFPQAQDVFAKIHNATGALRINNVLVEQTSGGQMKIDGRAVITSPIHLHADDYFPVPVTVQSGTIRVQTDKLEFQKMAISFHGTSLMADGFANITNGKLGLIDLSLTGRITRRTLENFTSYADLSELQKIRLPIFLKGLSVRYNNKLSVIGGFHMASGVDGTVNMEFDPATKLIHVQGLTFSDGTHTATVGLDWKDGLRNVSLNGTVTPDLMDKILTSHPITGTISGNMSISSPTNDFIGATANGTLRIAKFTIPDLLNFKIEEATLTGQGRTISVDSLKLTGTGQESLMKGTIRSTGRGLFLALEAEIQKLDIDEILNALETPKESSAPEKTRTEESSFKVAGKIVVSARDIKFQKRHLQFVVATIEFRGKKADVTVANASFCGIPMYGTVKADEKLVEVDIYVGDRDVPVRRFLQCLLDNHIQADGTMKVVGQITASAPPSKLKSSLFGQIAFASENGIVYQDGLVLGVLQVVNFVQPVNSPKGGGIPYKTVQGKATIKNSILTVDEFYLDSSVLKIIGNGEVNIDKDQLNLVLLVSPLRSIDRIVEKVPIVSHILGGSLLSIPVSITGSFDSPSIHPISPANIAAGLLRIVARTLTLPIQLATPDSNKPIPAKDLLKGVEDSTSSSNPRPLFDWRKYFGRDRDAQPAPSPSETTSSPTQKQVAPAKGDLPVVPASQNKEDGV